MVKTIASLRKEINDVRKELDYIKNILSENYELSEQAKKFLKEARNTPESKYVEV